MSRSARTWSGLKGRFAWAVLGAALASVVWLVAVLAFSMSPEQARARRATPELPPPTVAVRSVDLRQVAWFPCARRSVTVNVVAPRVPSGDRSVVTRLPDIGGTVRTGTELARVAGVRLIAVVADTVFYRDLRVGDRGADVRGLEKALQQVGAISSADGVLDAATIRAWRRFDPDGPSDRIRVPTLVAVPARASLGATKVRVGEVVKPGAVLREVIAGAGEFRCEVPNAGPEVTPASVTFKVGGNAVETASVTIRPRSKEETGHVLVTPKEPVTANEGQLGIESASSGRPVLAVPVSAVSVDASGRTVVVVVDAATQREVPVSLGVTAQGMVAITGDGVAEGTQVRLFDVAVQTPASPGPGAEPSPPR